MSNRFSRSLQRLRNLFRWTSKLHENGSGPSSDQEALSHPENKTPHAHKNKTTKLVNKIAINFLYYFPQQLGYVMEYVFLFISNQPYLVTSAGLSNTLVETLLIVPVFSLNLGLSTLVSQAVGAQQYGVAGFYLLRSILINLFVFTVCSLLLTYSDEAMEWMGSNSIVVEEATKYVILGFISSVLACIFDLMRNFIQAHQIFRIPALVQCCCTVGLILLEYIVVKHLGCGLTGLGICKIIGEFAKTVILFWYVRRAPKLRQSIISFRKDYFRLKVLWIQMKKQSFAGSLFFLDWFGFLLMCFIVSGLQSADVSSFFVSFTIITLFTSFADSISAPLGVMIGHAAGARNVEKVKLFIKFGFVWGVFVSVILSVVMALLKDKLPWMFTTKQEIADKSSFILEIFCWVFPFYMVQNIMVAVFRSLGKEKMASLMLFLSIYLIGIPLSALLGYPLKLGVNGVRYGYAIGLIVNAVLFIRLLWKMKIEDQVMSVSDQLRIDDQKNIELIEETRKRNQAQGNHPELVVDGIKQPESQDGNKARSDPEQRIDTQVPSNVVVEFQENGDKIDEIYDSGENNQPDIQEGKTEGENAQDDHHPPMNLSENANASNSNEKTGAEEKNQSEKLISEVKAQKDPELVAQTKKNKQKKYISLVEEGQKEEKREADTKETTTSSYEGRGI